MNSVQKGGIVKKLIAKKIAIRSDGRLLVDIQKFPKSEIKVYKKNRSNSIFIRLRSREISPGNRFSDFWNTGTIKITPQESSYLLFLRLDYQTHKIGNLWFIPSTEFNARGREIYKGNNADRYKSNMDGLVKKLNRLI